MNMTENGCGETFCRCPNGDCIPYGSSVTWVNPDLLDRRPDLVYEPPK